MYGGSEDDHEEGRNDGEDTLYGEAGSDEMYGGGEDDTLDGGSGSDEMYGGAGDDTLLGGSGGDEIDGGEGDDTIDGGTGNDDLTGGFGDDVFKFSRSHGNDEILDFTPGEDRIDLSAFTDIKDFDDIEMSDDDDVEITTTGSRTITLEGVRDGDLTERDFIFASDTSGDGDGDGDDDSDGDGDGDGDDDTDTPVAGDSDPDRLHGSSTRDDNLNGGGGNDVLYGARGDDTLTGGADVDSYEGGPGNDTLVVDYDDFTDGKEDPTGPRMGMGLLDGGGGSDTLSFEKFENKDHGGGVIIAADGALTFDGGLVIPADANLFRSIENFIGSPENDTIDVTGDNKINVIEGGAGQDTLTTNDNEDFVSYRSSPSSVNVTIGGQALKGHAASDSLTGFVNIIGSAYGDILTGNGNDNIIEGLAGADTLDGGAHGDNGDTLSYASSNAAVTIDLNQGTGDFNDDYNTIKTANGGHATGDKVKFESFENVIGSVYGDTITGDDNNNKLNGGPGGDRLDGDGNGDTDTATYKDATEGVTVDLSGARRNRDEDIEIPNSGGRGEARGDRFTNIERFEGSAHDDIFIAGPEKDDIVGGDGTDTISYERSITYAVVVTLGDTTASVSSNQTDSNTKPYEVGDVLAGIENIIGTNARSDEGRTDTTNDIHDQLTGDGEANEIKGLAGNDMINGGGGADTLIGGRGDDKLAGGEDSDDTFIFSRGDGNDTITDWNAGYVLDLSAFGTRFYLTVDDDGSGSVIKLSSSQTITLEDSEITVGGLTEDNLKLNNSGKNDITGNPNNNYIWGGEGNDTLKGGGGDDHLYGGRGDDVINGQAGADVLDGGEGGEVSGDTLSYASSDDRTRDADNSDQDTDGNPYISGVTVALNSSAGGVGTYAENDEFVNGGRFENLIGSSYDDNLTGSPGDNVIDGGSGNDTIFSGGGADTLKGGSGNDVITGDGDDKVEGGSGSDRLHTNSPTTDFLSYESSSGVTVDLSDITKTLSEEDNEKMFGVDSVVTGVIKVSRGASGDIATGFKNVIGSGSGDTLIGDSDANILRGLGGSDTIKGGDGDDTLDGGAGGDKLEGDAGTDTASYASASDGVTVDLSGGNGSTGDARGDTYDSIEKYEGSEFDDTFIAGKSEDDIDGNAHKGHGDTVSYIKSDKGVTVDLSSPDQGDEGEGYEKGDMLNGIENIIGSNHDDTLTALSIGSIITSGRGNDTLNGGDGDDILNGGRGVDVFNGGPVDGGGMDTFVFAPGDGGDDEINGFTAGDGDGHDQIDLSAFKSIASMDDLTISQLGSDAEIDLPNGGEIRLNEVDKDGLTADNFIFYTKKISGTQGDHFNNEINGSSGDNALYGEQGNDTINGGRGDDEIYGGEDNDTINGGAGDDWLDGGPGADIFVFESGGGNDVIMDFEDGVDKIVLKGFKTADGTAATLADFALTDATAGDSDFVIKFTEEQGGGSITISGVTTGIDSGDFMVM